MSAGGGPRRLLSRLPTLSARTMARRLTRRGDAARDAGRWQAAAALYDAALAIAPRGAIHVQYGHVLKEAGDFDGAERQYLAALRLMPDDADLALQLGHLHKTRGRLDEAEAAYRRALALAPGSAAAAELARLGDGPSKCEASDGLVPELLPGAGAIDASSEREAIVVRRLGIEGERHGRVLRGVQAIRGWAISATPLRELHLLVDGTILRREPLVGVAVDGSDRAKYVFNLWQDFSSSKPGEAAVELRFVDAAGRARAHRSTLLIEPPHADAGRLDSDAYVPPTGAAGGAAEAWVDALPSVVRPATRAALPVEPSSILIQRVDQLGDLVCSVPAIERLRALFPQARLVGLVSPANADLARALGLFDELVPADFAVDPITRRRAMPAPEQRALRDALAAHDFDLAIDLSESGESRPLLRLSGARFLYGFGGRDFPWLDASLDIRAPDPLDGQETSAPSRKLVALVEGLGALQHGRARIITRAQGSDATAPKEPYALLHTGARLRFSRWPGFAELARLLLERTDLHVVMMHDHREDAPPRPPHPRLRVITGRLPFDEFDALLARAAVFVGNDSGPKHLAALRGTPVVSLHMARLNWNEWGQELTGSIVSRRVPCAGCGIADDPGECGRDFACIRRITPEEVLKAALTLLDG